MAKYNFELKKKIGLEHLSLGVGSKALAKKYNVKSARQIQQWIHNYNEFGEEGLKRSRQKNNYNCSSPVQYLGQSLHKECTQSCQKHKTYSMLPRAVHILYFFSIS